MEVSKGTKRLFTLLEPNSAIPGSIWIYVGESEECLNCQAKEICHGSIYPGMLFEILDRRGAKNFCKLRETEVETVEIKRPKMTIAIDNRLAKEGAITEYVRRDCYEEDCSFIGSCVPFDLRRAQKIKVTKVIKSFPCSVEPEKTFSLVDIEPL